MMNTSSRTLRAWPLVILAALLFTAVPAAGEPKIGKGTIIFENRTSEPVDVQLDGYYVATVASRTKLTLRKVPAGRHTFFGQSVSIKWAQTSFVLKADKVYTWELK